MKLKFESYGLFSVPRPLTRVPGNGHTTVIKFFNCGLIYVTKIVQAKKITRTRPLRSAACCATSKPR